MQGMESDPIIIQHLLDCLTQGWASYWHGLGFRGEQVHFHFLTQSTLTEEVCNQHGTTFDQTPDRLTRGYWGCPLCRRNPAELLARAEEDAKKHGGELIPGQEWRGNKVKLQFRCGQHDVIFGQEPRYVKTHWGCPHCMREKGMRGKQPDEQSSPVKRVKANHNDAGNAKSGNLPPQVPAPRPQLPPNPIRGSINKTQIKDGTRYEVAFNPVQDSRLFTHGIQILARTDEIQGEITNWIVFQRMFRYAELSVTFAGDDKKTPVIESELP